MEAVIPNCRSSTRRSPHGPSPADLLILGVGCGRCDKPRPGPAGAGHRPLAVAIAAVSLGFRYQKIIVDRERMRLGYLGEMPMVVDALVRYLKLFETTEGDPPLPSPFGKLDPSGREFPCRYRSLRGMIELDHEAG